MPRAGGTRRYNIRGQVLDNNGDPQERTMPWAGRARRYNIRGEVVTNNDV